jgi:hypothetical protein
MEKWFIRTGGRNSRQLNQGYVLQSKHPENQGLLSLNGKIPASGLTSNISGISEAIPVRITFWVGRLGNFQFFQARP